MRVAILYSEPAGRPVRRECFVNQIVVAVSAPPHTTIFRFHGSDKSLFLSSYFRRSKHSQKIHDDAQRSAAQWSVEIAVEKLIDSTLVLLSVIFEL